MASLPAQITALLLPKGYHRRACGQCCVRLRPAPLGTLTVTYLSAHGPSVAGPGAGEVGAFGALRADGHRWLVAVVTADETWFHGEYTDARVLRQHGGDAPEPLRTVLTAEIIVLE